MRAAGKALLNAGYRWMEANPVTVMLVALGLGAFASAAVVGVALRGESTRSIVTRSACAIDPAGRECQKVKRESDRVQSRADACIPIRKVDREGRLLRLTHCPGVERGRELQANSKEDQNSEFGGGEEAPAPGGGAGVAPVPGNGDDSEPQQPTKPGKPRHDPPPAPGNSGSEGGGPPAGPVASQPSAINPPPVVVVPPVPPAEVPGKGPVQGAVEGVGKAGGEVVEKAGGAVNETLCTVRGLLVPCPHD